MKFFITGSDTDVGKSFVTASLLRAFLEQGAKAVALKPVQTGYAENSRIPKAKSRILDEKSRIPDENSRILDEKSRIPKAKSRIPSQSLEPDFKEYIKAGQNADFKATCYTFAYPASPHFSAELEGKKIKARGILDFIEQNLVQITLIEGAGGILVPLNESQSFLDIAKELNAPVILVCKNCLGAINHALLNLEILRQNSIKLAALILNFHDENDAICLSNQQFLQKKFSCPIITLKNYKNNENYSNSAKDFRAFISKFLDKK